MKVIRILFALLSVFILLGCWETRLLKESKIVMLIGFDESETENLKTTVSIPIPISREEVTKEVEVIESDGKNVMDTLSKNNRKLSGNLDISKNTAILIDSELAKKDIYNLFDLLYRNSKASLIARVAVVNSKSNEIINSLNESSEFPSEKINHFLDAAEQNTQVPIENLQTICPRLFDEGEDIILPILDYKEDNILLAGTALFNGKKMTGTLTVEESSMFLLLNDNFEKNARFTFKIYDKKLNDEIKNNISVNILNLKRDIDVKVNKDEKVELEIKLDLEVNVIEFPEDNLYNEDLIEELNMKLKNKFNSLSNDVIKKLKDANSDAFGIGRRLIAFNKDYYDKINWKQIYPETEFTIKINVDVVRNGIIN